MPAAESHQPRQPRLFALLLLLLAVLFARPGQARCIDEQNLETPPPSASDTTVPDISAPRLTLQGMVHEALRRSNAIGAARLLAEAAASDAEEARAGASPQATLSATTGGMYGNAPGAASTQGATARANLNVSALLYDAGRTQQITHWRSRLAESARLGQLTTQDQIALQTVSLALDRNRYRLQAQVYQQYERKMSCLVEALTTIVSADKGRASELVQARKTLLQAELLQAQTASALSQTNTRLARFIGDALPSSEGLSSVLLSLPLLDDVLAEAERSNEILAQGAAAQGLENYAKAVVAGQKPQFNWVLTGAKSVGTGSATSLMAGVSLSIPLLNPGADHSISAARKRAEAARLQREDALEARKFRIAEVYEQAASAFDRARRTVEVVRNSDRVRNFTLQQWQQMGRRSLFDVMGAESEHYNLRVAYVNALHDGQQASALLRSLGLGIGVWLE